MKFRILSNAVKAAEQVAAEKRAKEVNTLIEKLTAIWGNDAKARSMAWNIAIWRMRRGLSLDIKKVLP